MLHSTKVKHAKTSLETAKNRFDEIKARFEEMRFSEHVTLGRLASVGENFLHAERDYLRAKSHYDELNACVTYTYKSRVYVYFQDGFGYNTLSNDAPFRFLQPVKDGIYQADNGKHYRIKGSKFVYHPPQTNASVI